MTGGWGTPRPQRVPTAEERDRMRERYSGKVLHNAELLLADPDQFRRDDADASVYWVTGSTGAKYRVQIVPTDGSEEPDLPWVACTCPNGMNKGGQPGCYHSCAALMVWLDDRAKE